VQTPQPTSNKEQTQNPKRNILQRLLEEDEIGAAVSSS
jgi:hypothetical protein